MNQQLVFCLLVLILSNLIFHLKAQSSVSSASASNHISSNFEPSLAVVIGVLFLMFSLTFLVLMYLKHCHRTASSVHFDPENHPPFLRSRSRFSGIDKNVIESLPFFRFCSLKGSREGLECAVCLSKFEDIEILRLLPKCKHAFHIDCIDQWLEKHSSCPLCRQKVNPEDQTILTYSNSLRFLSNQSQSALGDDESNIEIFVQREEEEHENYHGSSRFSIIGSSFRRSQKDTINEEELPIQQEAKKAYHKHKHKITISDVVFKNRWSNVSSSDLMFLNSEMIGSMSSRRFSKNLESNADRFPVTRAIENDQQVLNVKEEMERKISFESKVNSIKKINSEGNSSHTSKYVNENPVEKRSISEITAFSRFGDLGMKGKVFRESSLTENNVKEERMRQIWLPIARRTVQWFVNRERSQHSQK